jgi:hypothetical protein
MKTELPPILRDVHGIGIPLLDTAKTHVTEIVQAVYGGGIANRF